jgi:hypothetical protein
MKCITCNVSIPFHARYCPVCQDDIGYPNVRAAQTIEEKSALQKRFDEAQRFSELNNYSDVLDNFGKAVLQSKAVIARNISVLWRLVSSDNELYASFYQQVNAELRIPEDNQWDKARQAIDAMLFPLYNEHIIFAALSLNNQGPIDYGSYSIILKEETIKNRATVFEENSILFCRKNKIMVGDSLPYGFRVVWAERNKLASAKLYPKLNETIKEEIFPTIILSQDDNDFIEVHIFGPIHRRAIERVIGPKPKNKEDQILFRSIEHKLNEIGAILEVL